MPIPMVLTSSDGFTGGRNARRFGGPVFSGSRGDESGVGGPRPSPGAVALIQSTSPLLTQLVATTAEMALASYVYITQGSVAVTSSNTANVGAAPPYVGIGAALYYDTGRKKLSVFSTVLNDWLSVTLSSS